ncbi:hypothetical protein [Corynebacterium aquilae]|uniref:DUF2628 domain-containing protein n=1 Tax=Corynebacterium aquilae DSM 44791 TaxID=1431546 RepID=A0A1L7CER7_9CORY|nr:hypothetical protein [Corynebacterium aquilae]APT84370.1 hypothetical protein CAQU_03995 [Corynebacterium aquilae DSM 44791]
MALFGYTPPQRFDLLPEIVDGQAVERTKSRAYKMAVWSGLTGIQWAFLGQRSRAWRVYFFSVGLPLLLAFGLGLLGVEDGPDTKQLFWALVVWPIIAWVYQVWKIANMADDDPLFTGATEKDFFPPRFWTINWQWWSPESWGKKSADDEQLKKQAIEAARLKQPGSPV